MQTVEPYPCAVRCVQDIAGSFGLERSGEAIASAMGPDRGEHSLADIAGYVRADLGLHALPLRGDLRSLSELLRAGPAIAHAAGSDGTSGHFVVVRRTGEDLAVCDPPRKVVYTGIFAHPSQLRGVERTHQFSGAYLVVSKTPLAIPASEDSALPSPALLVCAAAVLLAAASVLLSRRIKAGRKPTDTAIPAVEE